MLLLIPLSRGIQIQIWIQIGTDSQTNLETDRFFHGGVRTDRKLDRQTGRETDIPAFRLTDRLAVIQKAYKQTDRQVDRQMGGLTERRRIGKDV
jgi:hypothetical protein